MLRFIDIKVFFYFVGRVVFVIIEAVLSKFYNILDIEKYSKVC